MSQEQEGNTIEEQGLDKVRSPNLYLDEYKETLAFLRHDDQMMWTILGVSGTLALGLWVVALKDIWSAKAVGTAGLGVLALSLGRLMASRITAYTRSRKKRAVELEKQLGFELMTTRIQKSRVPSINEMLNFVIGLSILGWAGYLIAYLLIYKAMNLSDRTVLVIALALVISLGLIRLVREKSRVSGEIAFSEEFIRKLKTYFESNGHDNESYVWLTDRSSKMQNQMGAYGIYVSERPPYANIQYQNYPIILNILPELRKTLEDKVLSRDIARQYAVSLQEKIILYVGVLEDRENEFFKSIRNPVIWFREGIRVIVALPLSILEWLGVLSEKSVSALITSKAFRLCTAIVSIVSFVCAVMGIALGWGQFQAMLKGWLDAF